MVGKEKLVICPVCYCRMFRVGSWWYCNSLHMVRDNEFKSRAIRKGMD